MSSRIPSEILQDIFKYLTEDKNVAKHLKHKELYKCLFVNKFCDELNKNFNPVNKLKIICCTDEDNEGLFRFIMGLKKSECLKIQGSFMNLPKIAEALRNNLRLTSYSLIKLHIQGNIFLIIPVNLNQLANIIQNINGSLESLHLSWHHEIDSENGPTLFKNIARNCPELKELYTSVSILSIQIIPEIILSCYNLTHITIILNTLDGLLDVSQDLSKILPKIGMVISSSKLKSFTLALYHLGCNIDVFKEFFNYLYQNNIKNFKFNVFHRTSYKYRNEIKEFIIKYVNLGILHPNPVNHWIK
ncbi:hypothetical protein GLOIN_2v1867876 [Rhizophagus clarus]|uniref:F-box domain-containing protein n=1 Tax=Rhizophagus clarus TaxID=94130 RepID=A0A8H3LUC3_9GLOM|nr:hypothetical protein GLOIN_2v1867876 [Rhizophagus clarus]